MSGRLSPAGAALLEEFRRRVGKDRRSVKSYRPAVVATKISPERCALMRGRLAELVLELEKYRPRALSASRREIKGEMRKLIDALKAGEDRLRLGFVVDAQYEHEDGLRGARIAVRLDTLEVHAIERLPHPKQQVLFR